MVETLVPHVESLDSSLDLYQEGYLFIKNRMDQLHTDLFTVNLLAQKVICISGSEAAGLFYNPDLFLRSGAAPKHVQKTLLGENAIQSMDGEEHLARKAVFLSLTSEEYQKKLVNLIQQEFPASVEKWEAADQVAVFCEAKSILCKAACRWTGVPLEDSEVSSRAEEFSAMVDGFGGIGPRYFKGKIARGRTEDWIGRMIDDVRSGKLKPEPDSGLSVMAMLKDANGIPVDAGTAAKELINLIRPVVAVATYIAFTALALHEHPEWKEKLMTEDDHAAEMFIREVRRYYPFTPFLGARVKKDFSWNQCEFKKGTLVLLDVYGTSHDERLWNNPNLFNPSRFQDKAVGPYEFIPQGGGDPATGHRCPGEGVVTEVMKAFLNFFVNDIRYEVPAQDFSFRLDRIPTRPESGFIITGVKGV